MVCVGGGGERKEFCSLSKLFTSFSSILFIHSKTTSHQTNPKCCCALVNKAVVHFTDTNTIYGSTNLQVKKNQQQQKKKNNGWKFSIN